MPLCRGLGEKEEGWEKAHPLTLFYLQTVFTLYFHIADQASDLSVQNPMTTAYLTGHLTSVSSVPAPRWRPAELEHKPIFKHPCILRMIVCILLCVCVCAQKLSVSNSLSLHGLYPWDFSAHGIPRQKYCSGLPFPPPGESSWPKGRTRVSWVSGSGRQILYHWATSEAQVYSKYRNEVNRIREEKYYLV